MKSIQLVKYILTTAKLDFALHLLYQLQVQGITFRFLS